MVFSISNLGLDGIWKTLKGFRACVGSGVWLNGLYETTLRTRRINIGKLSVGFLRLIATSRAGYAAAAGSSQFLDGAFIGALKWGTHVGAPCP